MAKKEKNKAEVNTATEKEICVMLVNDRINKDFYNLIHKTALIINESGHYLSAYHYNIISEKYDAIQTLLNDTSIAEADIYNEVERHIHCTHNILNVIENSVNGSIDSYYFKSKYKEFYSLLRQIQSSSLKLQREAK